MNVIELMLRFIDFFPSFIPCCISGGTRTLLLIVYSDSIHISSKAICETLWLHVLYAVVISCCHNKFIINLQYHGQNVWQISSYMKHSFGQLYAVM